MKREFDRILSEQIVHQVRVLFSNTGNIIRFAQYRVIAASTRARQRAAAE